MSYGEMRLLPSSTDRLRPSHLRIFIQSAKLIPQTKYTITDPEMLADEIKIIKDRGFSTDNEEFLNSMIAVAVPISDSQGRLLATLSVHAPTQRISLEQLTEYVPLISEKAEKLMSLLAED